jgi:hypothetical protein
LLFGGGLPNREVLHVLVDALSEDVLEHAERVLTHRLSWPQRSPDIQELKAEVHERVHQVEMVGRHLTWFLRPFNINF